MDCGWFSNNCLTDADGDGYGEGVYQACYVMNFSDSNYLGWDGNTISVFEDGHTGRYLCTSQIRPACPLSIYADIDAAPVVTYLMVRQPTTMGGLAQLDLSLYCQAINGDVLIGQGSGSGSSSQTFTFDGSVPRQGAIFYRYSTVCR